MADSLHSAYENAAILAGAHDVGTTDSLSVQSVLELYMHNFVFTSRLSRLEKYEMLSAKLYEAKEVWAENGFGDVTGIVDLSAKDLSLATNLFLEIEAEKVNNHEGYCPRGFRFNYPELKT